MNAFERRLRAHALGYSLYGVVLALATVLAVKAYPHQPAYVLGATVVAAFASWVFYVCEAAPRGPDRR